MAPKIIYTHTDEAPALATYSLLPIIEAFAGACGAALETRDISLAGRILAAFPDRLTAAQQVPDALAELGALVKQPGANIIKLPNISASVPQIKEAVAELQAKGFDLPDYPEEPTTAEEEGVRARYDQIKGSAVNPVLREGNSDRRAPRAVKDYARANPHSMGDWSSSSDTHVATMDGGDFRSSEQSVTMTADDDLRIEHVDGDGAVTVLKESTPVLAGEIVDAAVMSRQALVDFLRVEIDDAADRGVLFSLHLKATMMKVSDPIIFGQAVRVFFADVFARFGDVLERAGADPNDGLAAVLADLAELPAAERGDVELEIDAILAGTPDLAMVNSDKGITNLHVPSDVIVDASMPAMIRTSGQMWNPAGEQQDTKAVIPDSSYAPLYAETIADCKINGAFDPTTMGTVPNVGLMAQKAEEYGSHDKTFEVPADGLVRIVDKTGQVVLEHDVAEGDIWRGCQTKDAPVQDWVKLAVTRARATGAPAVFWLDATRAHDAEVLAKVDTYLADHDTNGLQIAQMAPAEATRFTLGRARAGEDTISVTGNVLRDYLTDLFPILELGTSAKMLSIVPLMAGGGLFETGAGGSAPKHVQQFEEENHLRWDSLGEFLALVPSLEMLSEHTGDRRAQILADALDAATGAVLQNGNSPSRKVNEHDNRGSHVALARYWAEALAAQTEDTDLAATFAPLATELAAHADTIDAELVAVQGVPMDIGGYYRPDVEQATAAMRPSATFNRILSEVAPDPV
jgi:isocitrate dehydrogenase